MTLDAGAQHGQAWSRWIPRLGRDTEGASAMLAAEEIMSLVGSMAFHSIGCMNLPAAPYLFAGGDSATGASCRSTSS